MSPKRDLTRPGYNRQNMHRDDIWHCGQLGDHGAHVYRGDYWCPGGPAAGPGGTLLPPGPDTRRV